MPPGKDKDFGLSPEISRLSAILARDPNSKLFIALAEEYMKAGMAQEAVMTLERGLESSPYYMSARVMLGKAYLETGDTHKAREQFEMVVKSVPDNLLAHKKLGEIYRMQGRPADAARSLKMVTLLNPKDEEAKKLLAELESAPASAPSETREKPSGEMDFESHRQGSAPRGLAPRPELPPIPVFDPTESFDAVPEAETAGPVLYEVNEPGSAHDEAAGEPEVIEMPVPDNMATLEDIPYAVEADLDEEEESIPDAPAVAGEEDEARATVEPAGEPAGYGLNNTGMLEHIFAAYQDSLPGEEGKPESEGVYEIEADISAFEMDGVKIEPVKKEPFETETLAELYISQGFYDRAINIYKNLLMELPDDSALKQKLEDLYLMASTNPAPGLAEVGTEAATGAEVIEAVDFEDEPEEAELYEGTEAGQMGIDSGAVRRLEQFLENIRRKAGR